MADLSWLTEEDAPPAEGPTLKVPGSPGYDEQFSSRLSWLNEPSKLERFVGRIQEPDPIPAPFQALKRGAEGTLEGANERIAQVLGFPVDVVNDALRLAGANNTESGSGTQALMDAFRRAGVRLPEGAERSLTQKIGGEVINQLLGYGGARLAAPTLQKVGGTAGAVGDALLDKPVTGLATSVTSAPGVVLGGEYGGKGGKIAGEFIGEQVAGEDGTKIGGTIGEGIGGALGSIVGGTATAVVGMPIVRSVIPASEKGGFKPYDAPLQDPNADPTEAVASARKAVERATMAIDRRIQRTIEGVNKNRLSPEKSAQWLKTSLERTRDAARSIEESAWDQIDPRETIDLTPVYQVVQQMRANGYENAIPTSLLAAFERRAVRVSPDGDVDVVVQPFSWVRQFRSDIRRESMNASGYNPSMGARNGDMVQSLADLETAVMSSISRSLPQRAAWERAREISQVVNDRFTRGPVGQLLGTDRQTQDLVPPAVVAKRILDDPDGVKALLRAGEPVSSRMGDIQSGVQPGERWSMADALPAEPRQEFIEAARDMTGRKAMPVSGSATTRATGATGIEASVRAEFEAAAKKAAQYETDVGRKSTLLAKGGEDFAIGVKDHIENLTGVATDVKKAGENLGKLWRARRDFEKSAVARYAEKDPDKAIADVFNQGDPAKAARELMQRMKGDPDAIRGLKAGLIDHFMGMGGNRSMSVANRRLGEDTRWGRVFDTVLGKHDAERFRMNVAAAAKLENGDRSALTKFSATGTSYLAGWVGLTTGKLASMANPSQAGALSYPMEMKRTFQRLAAQAFDFDNPWEVLSRAIIDPKQEAWLRSQMPDNGSSGRAAERTLRRMFIAERASFERAIDLYEERETAKVRAREGAAGAR